MLILEKGNLFWVCEVHRYTFHSFSVKVSSSLYYSLLFTTEDFFLQPNVMKKKKKKLKLSFLEITLEQSIWGYLDSAVLV